MEKSKQASNALNTRCLVTSDDADLNCLVKMLAKTSRHSLPISYLRGVVTLPYLYRECTVPLVSLSMHSVITSVRLPSIIWTAYFLIDYQWLFRDWQLSSYCFAVPLLLHEQVRSYYRAVAVCFFFCTQQPTGRHWIWL